MEGSSIEKVFWSDIKEYVIRVNPEFAEIIENIKSNKNYPLYLLQFPYGELVGDDISQFIPDNKGSSYRLSSQDLPDDIAHDLSYGANTSPLGLMLDKKIEFFVDLPNKNQTIPIGILSPGNFYNTSIVLSRFRKKPYNPNGLLKASSGARTVFSLPYLTCKTSFTRLQREIGPVSIPQNPYDHCLLFKDIIRNSSKNIWKIKFIYFSKNWVKNIMDNPEWVEVKNYLSRTSWENSEHERNQFYFDIAYSLMQEKANFSINPYLIDTAKHILDIGLGAYPGIAPAIHDDLIPLKNIQHVLVHSYRMSKYIPTIMIPEYFSENGKPVYYSLQYPTTKLFSPKSKNTISTLKNLEDLHIIIHKFHQQIVDSNGLWNGSFLQEILRNTKISYIHNIENRDIKPVSPEYITSNDDRFSYTKLHIDNNSTRPAIDAKFFRGCISLSNK